MSGLEAIPAGAILSTAIKIVSRTIIFGEKIYKARKEFADLVDELEQVQAILHTLQDVQVQGVVLPDSLIDLVKKVKDTMLQVELLLHHDLTKTSDSNKVKRIAWANRSDKAQKLTSDLRELISKMTATLGLTNLSQSSISARHQDRVLNTISERLEQQQEHSGNVTFQLQQLSILETGRFNQNRRILSGIESQHKMLTEFIQRIEESEGTRDKLAGFLERSELESSGVYSHSAVLQLDGSKTAKTVPSPLNNGSTMNFFKPANGSWLQLKGVRNTGIGCKRSCRCSCHKQRTIKTPAAMEWWTGSMQARYSSINWFRPRCNIRNCKRASPVSATIQYRLPVWLGSKMIAAWYQSTPFSGPELLLQIARVHDSSLFQFVAAGDIDRVRELLLTGEASLHDVSSQTFTGVLFWAVHGSRFEMFDFLLKCGANIQQQDKWGLSVQYIAFIERVMYQNQGFIESIVDVDDYIDDIDFTSLHKIVCGLSEIDLEMELLNHSELLDIQDSYGRTPLHWAALLQLPKAVKILLDGGADVTITDSSGLTALNIACNFYEVTRLILDSEQVSDGRALRTRRKRYDDSPWHESIDGRWIELLNECSCDYSPRNAFGRTMLHKAMYRSNDTGEALMALQAAVMDPNIRDWGGQTAWRIYEWYYPTKSKKATYEGRVGWALLKYVESLRNGGDGTWQSDDGSNTTLTPSMILERDRFEEVFSGGDDEDVDDGDNDNSDNSDDGYGEGDNEALEPDHTRVDGSSDDEDDFEDAFEDL